MPVTDVGYLNFTGIKYFEFIMILSKNIESIILIENKQLIFVQLATKI